MPLQIQEFFHAATSTLTYVVYDSASRDAVAIDPVLDFDNADGRVWTASVDAVIDFIRRHDLRLHDILETHAHADHLSGAQNMKKAFPSARLGIGENIREVQKIFGPRFRLADFRADGSQFDRLFRDGEKFQAGALNIQTIFTPGHTPACACFLVNGTTLFTGDAIFMPDSGTGRCDFPGGSAEALYHSVHEKIYALPDTTEIYVGHDYQPGGRALKFRTTVGEQKKSNIHLKSETTREAFLEFRTSRDKTLEPPKLLMPSLQVNIAAGRWQNQVANGDRLERLNKS